MNSIHYDVIIFTSDIEKGIAKIEEQMRGHNETIYKNTQIKYITDKRTYIIIDPYKQSTRGLRYYEAYIDNEIEQETIEQSIYTCCLPYTDNWKDRIHKF